VRNWFQNFVFEWVNLCRYVVGVSYGSGFADDCSGRSVGDGGGGGEKDSEVKGEDDHARDGGGDGDKGFGGAPGTGSTAGGARDGITRFDPRLARALLSSSDRGFCSDEPGAGGPRGFGGSRSASSKAAAGKEVEDVESESSRAAVIAETLTSLALCHTLIIERDEADPTGSGESYQGASPDEVALAQGAASMGFRFAERTASHITVDTINIGGELQLSSSLLGQPDDRAKSTARSPLLPSSTRRTWEVLNVLDFSSERQRMSIIVRSKGGRQQSNTAGNTAGGAAAAAAAADDGGGEITLYCKGADARVIGLLAAPNPGDSPARTAAASELLAASKRHIHAFACKGLRTLVVAKRKLTHAEWVSFDRQYQAVGSSVDSDKVGLYTLNPVDDHIS
jgi:magnesium-transporting ATPase (P-type)